MNMSYKKILRNFHKVAVNLIALILLFASNLSAAEYWVATDGVNDPANGSYENPYQTITYAIGAVNPNDTITVKPGTYDGGLIVLINGIHLRSEMGAEVTTLTRNGLIMYLSDASQGCVIDGFTFLDGTSGALFASYCDFTLSNSVIKNCVADSAGAVYLSNCEPDIFNNKFIKNSSVESAAAIFCANSGPKIYNNEFDSNSVSGGFGRGGAITISYVGPNEGSVAVIQNNIFRDNSAQYGGAIFAASSRVYVYNNLFVSNTATSGGGLYIEYDYNPYIYNNIFMYNSDDPIYASSTTFTHYDNNNYFGNTPNNDCLGCPPASHVYFVDPYFEDYANRDYHLTDSSAMINKGRTFLDNLIFVDFDNHKRVLAGTIDIGPDEFADCNIGGNFTALSDTAGCPGLAVQFAGVNMQGFYDSLEWDFGDGVQDWNVLNPIHGYQSPGSYDVTLKINTPCTTVTVTKTAYVNVMDVPVPEFGSDVTFGCAPLSVTFEDLTENQVDNYYWDFGDGSEPSNDANPVHIYEEPGFYFVKLRTVNACGQDSIIKDDYIEVISNAVADFTAEPLEGSAPLQVRFTDASLYSPISWEWKFGDETSDSEQNPTNQYIFPGIYDVQLVVENDCEVPDTTIKQDYITVFGYELFSYDTELVDKYHYNFAVSVDSLYGLYDRPIALSAKVAGTPRRGTVSFDFEDDTLSLFDSTNLHAYLSKDLARGDYEIMVIAAGLGAFHRDTIILDITSNADSIFEVSPLFVDFGEVPEDSAKDMSIALENISFFGDNLRLNVSNITTTSDKFSVTSATNFEVLAGDVRNINVNFAPAELGEFSGDLTIFSNDPAYPQFTVGLTGTGILERTPPVVDSTIPSNQYQEYPVTDPVHVYFSEALDIPISAAAQFFSVVSQKASAEVPGSVTYDDQNFMMTFTPSEGFRVEDVITVTLFGTLADLAGNTLDADGDGQGSGSPADDYIMTFTTGLAVYPGDANNDGIVNELDVLPLGIYFELTGDLRGGQSSWSRQPALSWDPVEATYADCNGDGLVNEQDLLVIGTNWGLTHEIEGAPIVFTREELQSSSANFDALNRMMSNVNLGEYDQKVRDIISGYLTAPADLESFNLGTNFPNPFNPITRIDFTVPYSCHVTLEVYNVLGQKVKLLVDETRGSGLNSVIWDGTDSNNNPVPSGVYFYRMSAEDYDEVRKMLLIR